MKEMVFEGGGLEEEWVMVFLGPLRVGSQLRRVSWTTGTMSIVNSKSDETTEIFFQVKGISY
ncbi:hypothetical protein QJS10_CPB17g00142 [Acorus calamus]|uniref:Uncharacterized protein n=1 Tax=Acorus calamus TaxID=4465 RepID=A0AAV9CTC3_ACOCL|nr:hypothetical protein QJS10_CPB17g00142 [Acorus calamus]